MRPLFLLYHGFSFILYYNVQAKKYRTEQRGYLGSCWRVGRKGGKSPACKAKAAEQWLCAVLLLPWAIPESHDQQASQPDPSAKENNPIDHGRQGCSCLLQNRLWQDPLLPPPHHQQAPIAFPNQWCKSTYTYSYKGSCRPDHQSSQNIPT